MKTNSFFSALAYLLGVIAFGVAGVLYTIGGSFAVWSPGHNVDYFINNHAGLLEKAGIAIGSLTLSLLFGLLVAFRRIRALELLVGTNRTHPNQSSDPMPRSDTPPAGQEPRHP